MCLRTMADIGKMATGVIKMRSWEGSDGKGAESHPMSPFPDVKAKDFPQATQSVEGPSRTFCEVVSWLALGEEGRERSEDAACKECGEGGRSVERAREKAEPEGTGTRGKKEEEGQVDCWGGGGHTPSSSEGPFKSLKILAFIKTGRFILQGPIFKKLKVKVGEGSLLPLFLSPSSYLP